MSAKSIAAKPSPARRRGRDGSPETDTWIGWIGVVAVVWLFCSAAARPCGLDAELVPAHSDGPYVFIGESGDYTSRRIVVEDGKPRAVEVRLDSKDPSFEFVPEGMDRPLRVRVRKATTPSRPAIHSAKQVFACSDIEGNATAMNKLLLAGGIIDREWNWKFGSGHVVCLGDFFDRGVHVTECLWILYELEAKAQAAGGAVHFVLGNHEVMNLTGDFRYVHDKYRESAKLLGVELSELHSADTVLGRWLRTRDVIVRIDGDLFVHGGVSASVASSGLALEELNESLRSGLGAKPWPDRLSGDLALAAGSPDGLVWFRGYVKEPVVAETDVTAALSAFGAKRVVVGHTIVPQIELRYDRRVLAIDVHHASGSSQAALRDGGDWFRILPDGSKARL